MNSGYGNNNDRDLAGGIGDEAVQAEYKSMAMKSSGITEPHRKLIQVKDNAKTQSGGNWRLDRRAKDLPTYPLYKAVTVQCNSNDVLNRIDDELRERSVEASFDNDKSQIMCKTSNFLEYSIDLYAGANDPDNVTVLEIIRRNGCSFQFREERHAIIQAAKDAKKEKSEPTVFEKPSLFQIPPEFLEQCKPPTEDELRSTLTRAVDDIHNCNPDARLFILQNLVSMTSTEPGQLPSESAQTMSELILKDNGAFSRDLIVEIVKSSISTNKNLDEQMMNACLSILFNVMDTMKRCNEKMYNKFLDGTEGRGYVEKLSPRLIDHISNFRTSIHNACLAMKCLLLMARSSEIISGNTELLEAIQNAKDYGKKRHFEIEKTAGSFLEQCS
jgi:hypothetical protein